MADTQPIVEQVDATELKSPPDENAATAAAESDDEQPKAKRSKKNATVKTREMRLEQNRKAARESRKRKKVLVEELQRSVIFFSRGASDVHMMCRYISLACSTSHVTHLL